MKGLVFLVQVFLGILAYIFVGGLLDLIPPVLF